MNLILSRRIGFEEGNQCFRRALYHWEGKDLKRLYDMVYNTPALRVGTSDRLRWVVDVSGLFSVASVYKRYELSPVSNSRIADFIWKNVSPPKVHFFGWLAWKCRIKTSTYLHRIEVLSSGADLRCIFCKCKVESVNHVLLFCLFIWRIWSRILHWWGIQWVIPGFVNGLLNWCTGIKLKKHEKMIWRAIPLAVLWSIWKQRNDSIFDNAQVDLDGLCEFIKVRIALWVKFSCHSIKYSVNNLVHNLQQVRVCIRSGS
ncbi:uncharacterized protein LOC114286155 [Camellia sinensis]|uniref:uncharacterized protein LOC114286155 n=1 Tax=Camellia sinensis TaxID=4442 RepID=UPI001036C0D2|nr:uncharacterized protein LOC114286155 [Camellia sinensis]